MAYNLAFLYNATMIANNGEAKTEMLVNVLSGNFYNKILKH